jgi:hypothetical protein
MPRPDRPSTKRMLGGSSAATTMLCQTTCGYVWINPALNVSGSLPRAAKRPPIGPWVDSRDQARRLPYSRRTRRHHEGAVTTDLDQQAQAVGLFLTDALCKSDRLDPAFQRIFLPSVGGQSQIPGVGTFATIQGRATSAVVASKAIAAKQAMAGLGNMASLLAGSPTSAGPGRFSCGAARPPSVCT